MLQLINKKKIYFYIFSFLILSTVTNQKFISNLKKFFLVQKISIEVNDDQVDKKILKKTNFVLEKNIFFLNEKEIIKNLDNLNFLETIKINKSYPATINIKAKVTQLLAITFLNQSKYFIGSNGKFISSKNITNKNELPIIFGKFEAIDYISLQQKIHKFGINNKIVKYYFHKNKRWDLYFENNNLVKLPSKNIDDALKIYKKFIQNNKSLYNIIIDLRIPNRMIVKYE